MPRINENRMSDAYSELFQTMNANMGLVRTSADSLRASLRRELGSYNVIARNASEVVRPLQAGPRLIWTDALPHQPPVPLVEPLAPWEIELLNASEPDRSVSGSIYTGQIENTEVGNPNTQNEGENSMPTETLEVTLPTTLRSQIFDNAGARNSLMTRLDIENWQTVLDSLQSQFGPLQTQVTRGSFRVDSRLISRHPTLGSVYIEYLQIPEAEQLISIASNGKMMIEIVPNAADPDVDPVYYTIRPLNDIDAAGFANYAGSGLRTISYREPGVAHVYLADLRATMQSYLDYKTRRGVYIREVMRTRMLSGNTVVTDKTGRVVDVEKRNTSLNNFLENVKKETKPIESPFKKIAILPHKVLSSRRWGIEIEAVDIYDIETPQHWILHGDGSLRSEDNFAGTTGNRVDHNDECAIYEDEDNDCDCDYENREAEVNRALGRARPQQTGEYNSPILHSFHSRGLKYLCDELEGRYSNSSAGVHVHVEASDLTPDQAVKLSMIYTALEPLFDKEYHRTARNFCKSVDLSEMISRLDMAKSIKGQKATSFRSSRRYFTVNLAALNTHGTVEFRAMGNIYEYEHLIRWAHFCREMVNIAKANVPQKAWTRVKTFEDLIVLFSKYGKETPTPDWAEDGKVDFEPIVAALGTENRRNPNARPSNAYTQYSSATAPVELFDDYYSKKAVTTGQKSQYVLGRY